MGLGMGGGWGEYQAIGTGGVMWGAVCSGIAISSKANPQLVITILLCGGDEEGVAFVCGERILSPEVLF